MQFHRSKNRDPDTGQREAEEEKEQNASAQNKKRYHCDHKFCTNTIGSKKDHTHDVHRGKYNPKYTECKAET